MNTPQVASTVYIVDDDEAKLDVGARRYRYMVSEGVKGVGGQTWAPLANDINVLLMAGLRLHDGITEKRTDGLAGCGS